MPIDLIFFGDTVIYTALFKVIVKSTKVFFFLSTQLIFPIFSFFGQNRIKDSITTPTVIIINHSKNKYFLYTIRLQSTNCHYVRSLTVFKAPDNIYIKYLSKIWESLT